MLVALLATATSALVLPTSVAHSRSRVRMAAIDDFAISRVVKSVQVFDGDYAAEICDVVTDSALMSIASKGSFSLAVPGGSVVSALGGLKADAFDFSKMHVFFCNEKIPSYPCIAGALEQTEKLGVPTENVHGFATEGTPAEIASSERPRPSSRAGPVEIA